MFDFTQALGAWFASSGGAMGSTLSRVLESLNGEVAAARTSVSWRPDGLGDVTTWAGVMQAIAGTKSPVEVWCPQGGGIYTIPASAQPYDINYATVAGPVAFGVDVNIANGAVLHNLSGIRGGPQLVGHCTAAPCLTFTPPMGGNPIIIDSFGGTFRNQGTRAMVDVGAGILFILAAFQGGGVSPGTPGVPVIDLTTNSSNMLVAVRGSGQLPDGFASGVAGSNLIYQSDGTGPNPLPLLPLMLGNVRQAPVYGMSCTLATRPTDTFGPIPIGCTVFVTDAVPPRNLSVRSNGPVVWVDGAGIVVP